MLGIIRDKNNIMTIGFKDKGDIIFQIGKSRNDISSSEYLVSYHNIKESPAPFFDIEEEFNLQIIISDLIKKNLIRSAHDVADGGLFITLVESSMIYDYGFDITSDAEIRTDAFLFGEAQSRVVVSVTPNKKNQFIDFMIKQKFAYHALGHVTKGELRIDDASYGFIKDIKKSYNYALENLIE